MSNRLQSDRKDQEYTETIRFADRMATLEEVNQVSIAVDVSIASPDGPVAHSFKGKTAVIVVTGDGEGEGNMSSHQMVAGAFNIPSLIKTVQELRNAADTLEKRIPIMALTGLLTPVMGHDMALKMAEEAINRGDEEDA